MKSNMTFGKLFASACLLSCALTTVSFAAHKKAEGAHHHHSQMDDLMKRVSELEAQAKKAPAPGARQVVSSDDSVKLTIYGHLNRAMAYYDNGYNSQLRHVDVNASSSRTRFTASGKINDCFKGGALMELEFISENSASVDIRNPHNKPAFAVRERLLDTFLETSWGKISLGQGEMASHRVMDLDMTGTHMVQEGLEMQTVAGGVRFATAKGDYFNQSGSGPRTNYTVGSIYNEILGSKRLDRVRIDTPNLWGFVLSTSHATNERVDVAARYSGEHWGTKVAGAFAYYWDQTPARSTYPLTSLSPAALVNNKPPVYGSSAFTPLADVGTNITSTYFADSEREMRARVNFAHLQQWGGSVAVLFPFGVSINAGYARQKFADQDKPQGIVNIGGTDYQTKGRKDAYTWGVKLGYQAKFFEIGKSCFAVAYAETRRYRISDPSTSATAVANNQRKFFEADNHNKMQVWGAYFAQHVDKLGTEIYLAWQTHEHSTLKIERTRYNPTGTVTAADWGTPVKTITSYGSNTLPASDVVDLNAAPPSTAQRDLYTFKSHTFKKVNAVLAGIRVKF